MNNTFPPNMGSTRSNDDGTPLAGITLLEFVTKEHAKLTQFYFFWASQQDKEIFPLNMEEGGWLEHLNSLNL